MNAVTINGYFAALTDISQHQIAKFNTTNWLISDDNDKKKILHYKRDAKHIDANEEFDFHLLYTM